MRAKPFRNTHHDRCHELHQYRRKARASKITHITAPWLGSMSEPYHAAMTMRSCARLRGSGHEGESGPIARPVRSEATPALIDCGALVLVRLAEDLEELTCD